jgi:hypothetical protein
MDRTELRAFLRRHSLRPSVAAAMVGVTPRAMSMYTGGDRAVPAWLAAFANLYDCADEKCRSLLRDLVRDEPDWRPADGFPDYEVSHDGQVRRVSGSKAGSLGLPLRQKLGSRGYLSVCLYRAGAKKTVQVHALVAAAFIGRKPAPGMMVCHKDGRRTRNRYDNLYWGTAAQNADDTKRHGEQRDKPPTRRLKALARMLSRADRERLDTSFGDARAAAVAEIADRLSVSQAAVRRLIRPGGLPGSSAKTVVDDAD